MNWYAVCDRQTGQLYSVGTVVADDLAEHLESIELDAQPDLSLVEWDASDKSFKNRSLGKIPVSPIEFLRRFTMAEEIAIRQEAKTDIVLEVFLARLSAATEVRLDHIDTITGVNYVASKGLITNDRVSEILD